MAKRRDVLRGGSAAVATWAIHAGLGTGCSTQGERRADAGTSRRGVPGPRAMVRTNWSQDPWAHGSYSYLPVGASPRLRTNLARPIDNRLFFAGEATDSDNPSTVHGANASGLRTARAVAAVAEPGEAIIIVGAGMAGLTAASQLATGGRWAHRTYAVTVLEARARTGGRIDSLVPEGATSPVERGAAWLHAIGSHELAPELEVAGATGVPFDYDQAILGPDGARLGDDYVEPAAAALYKAVGWAAERDDDRSIAEAIEASGAAENVDPVAMEHLLTTEVTAEYGASAEELSARYAFAEGNDGQDLLVVGGYARLTDRLLADAPDVELRLETPVGEVAYDGSGVSITTLGGEVLRADRAVITVPLGVLQAGDITFSPALPEDHLHAIDGLGMGLLDKVVFVFDEPFWDEDATMWTRVADGAPYREWFNLASLVGDVQLASLTGGEVARDWATKSDLQVRDAALGALAEFVAAGW
ncbi:MAG: FAD-dependent oxidoreductase [Microthrixaceae bacterium]